MSERKNNKLADHEISELANRAIAQLEKLFLRSNESMSPREMMLAYVALSGEERDKFDQMYARRVDLLRIATLLRQATPEQLRRVREFLHRKPRTLPATDAEL